LHDFSGKIARVGPLADARADDAFPLARSLVEQRPRGSLAAQRELRELREPAQGQREPVGFRRAHPHFF
jgi:hypothetical protein